MSDINAGTTAAASQLAHYQSQINSLVSSVLNNSRVLCVSETMENVVMWSHYADYHRGAVLQLRCLDDIDDNFIAAKPVMYTNEFPKFFSVDYWVRHLTGEKKIDTAARIYELAYLKHADWSYEREWRVHIPQLENQSEGGVSIMPKDIRVFSGLYFGCRMLDVKKSELLSIVEAKYPHMNVFEASKSDIDFSLNFRRLK